jgi:hypothetical protein
VQGSLLPTILLILLGGVLIGALIYFIQNLSVFMSLRQNQPNTVAVAQTGIFNDEVPEPRGFSR